MPSLRHRVLERLVRLSGLRRRMHLQAGGRGTVRYRPTRAQVRKYGARTKVFEGFPFHWFNPSGGASVGKGVVVFLHGGAFVMEAQPPHLAVCAKLAGLLGLRVYVPLYPLAPMHTPEAVRDWTFSFVAHVREHVGAAPLHLVGDSAGANLCLQLVRGGAEAERLVLWCPWVDLELDDAATRAQDGRCALLSRDSLRACAEIYAGAVPLDDPSISPLSAKPSGLPPTLILSGTRDLLHPTIVAFAEDAQARGEPVTLSVYDELFHDWMLLPTPEARRALAETARFIGGRGASAATSATH